MEAITLRQLLYAVHGQLLGEYGDLETLISGVDTDSRNIHVGGLFLPLIGERFDGHVYIDSALEAGAVGCLTTQEREHYRTDKFYIKVENTELALRDLAIWYKQQFKIPFIAVTGSVGKTTAKDMIAAVLGVKFQVLKTEGNFNNNLGLPLTILRLDESYQVCVLEMGMYRFGEIDYLGGIVKPDVGVITNIGDAHIERLGSQENIFKAKCELLPHIQSDGILVANGDDQWLKTLEGNAPVTTVFCGKGENLIYNAQVVDGDGTSFIRCHMHTPKWESESEIPALGEHMIYPATIAVAVAEHFGLTKEEIEQGLTQFVPTRMRMNILKRAQGITILDDTYNANPQSMRAAVSVLSDSRSGKKVAVLGDMLELGVFSQALHTGVGEYIGKTDIGCLIAIGSQAEAIAQGARDAGVSEVYHYAEKEDAKETLCRMISADTTFLLKASRGMHMEELTEYLIEQTKEG